MINNNIKIIKMLEYYNLEVFYFITILCILYLLYRITIFQVKLLNEKKITSEKLKNKTKVGIKRERLILSEIREKKKRRIENNNILYLSNRTLIDI
tara:strand:+ start:793 stop:1080 length:288 start_codon:yes stop_codon:yes gene_type:complete